MLLLSAAVATTRGGISPNLSGSAYLSGVNTESDTLHEQSLNQQYSLNWQKSLAPYLIARSSVNYYNYGVKQNLGTNGWRKEFAPSAELLWKHPFFNLGSTVQRRKSSSNDLVSDLTTDNLAINFRSRSVKYPYVETQVLQTDAYSSTDRGSRDTRDRAVLAGTGYTYRRASAAYNFSRRTTENRVDHREQLDYQHSLRLNQSFVVGQDAYSAGLGYRLDYRSQSDIAPPSAEIPREIPGLVGLYTNDATPDLSTLDTIPSLVDGVRSAPTTPAVDIGNGNSNWNLGADLGFTRSINRVYIYTDRPSGANVRWDAYKSQDNIVWTQIATTTSSFNTGFSRYEITFPPDTARHIKVVNYGLNDIASVLITEIEVLIDISDQARIDRHQTTHLISLNNTLRLTSKLTTAGTLYLRRESGSSLAAIRDETNYALSARYKFSAALQSGLRYERGRTDYKNTSSDIDKTASLLYDLQYRPLPTLAFLLSMASRYSYIQAMKSQELNSAYARITGDPLERLHLSTETGWSRNNLYLGHLRYDTWYYNASMNGSVIRSLDAVLTYLYQRTDDVRSDKDRTKSQYAARLTCRPTASILLDGSINLVHDFNRRYLVQEYIASWLVSPRLNLSGSASLTGLHGGERSDRYNAQLQYNLTPRSAFVVSYSEYDLTPTVSSRTASLQMGLRISL